MNNLININTANPGELQLTGLTMQPDPIAIGIPRTEADVTDLVENLGYKPHPPVQRGIGEFIKWYKSYFKMK
jgi:UDP-glucuronate 4-epimerase